MMSRFKRSVLFGTIIALIGWIVLWGIIFGPDPIPKRLNENIYRAYSAACKVNNIRGGTAGGVLLNTGYVLTAAHAVDLNDDLMVSGIERIVIVTFYDDKGHEDIIAGKVIYMARDNINDFALIELRHKRKSSIKMILDRPRIGDKVFTIGCPMGKPPHILFGYESLPALSWNGRATTTTYFGNSGGGVFNQQQELVGIVKAMGVHHKDLKFKFKVPYAVKGKWKYKTKTVKIPDFHALADWTSYNRSLFIYAQLYNVGLQDTVVIREQDNGYGLYVIYLKMLFQILGVIWCVWFFKREIFGENVYFMRRNNARVRKNMLLRRTRN